VKVVHWQQLYGSDTAYSPGQVSFPYWWCEPLTTPPSQPPHCTAREDFQLEGARSSKY
jgi:hypothetical protein